MPAAPAPSATPSLPHGIDEAVASPTARPSPTATPIGDVSGAEPTTSEEIELPPPAIEERETAESPRGMPESEPVGRATIPPWRAVEVTLGLIALGLGLTTVWAWRARRR